MTKTPEELTKDWKAEELEDGLYYILLENGKTPISELETWYRTNIEESKEYYETEQAFYGYSDNMISEVLAPVPTYDEYKARICRIPKTFNSKRKRRVFSTLF